MSAAAGMSLLAKSNGFTAWVNMRLAQRGCEMENVLKDLNRGLFLKMLQEEITGTTVKRLDTLDGMSFTQKQLRFDWFVGELKKRHLLPFDFFMDTRALAALQAEKLFSLLWEIVKRDIIHVWEEGEVLQLDDNAILSEPFQWNECKSESFSSGRSSAGMKSSYSLAAIRSRRKRLPRPDAEDCILQLISDHVGMTRDCRRLDIEILDDLADSRVLCGLLNSFVPGTFTSEVLLNDRWTINLVLRTAEDILGIHSSVSSADLMEADKEATCAYMCSLFMLGYKFRQSRAAVCRQNELHVRISSAEEELQRFPPLLESMTDMKRKKELSEQLEKWQEETGWIEMNYNIPKCREWLRHAEVSQQKAHALITEKIRQRFDVLTVPRNMTINELVDSLAINLSLSCGSGFFSCSLKETLWVGRKVVLRDVETGEFYDDFTGNGSQKKSVREMLGARAFEVIEVSPSQFADTYEIFFESQTRNRMLKAGSRFLYQVFPGTSHQCQRLMFNAAKMGDLDTVKKLVVFFKKEREFVNSKESGSGNTALHFACRNGHLDVIQHLLENGADINSRNYFRNTPLFLAIESLNRGASQLLIEWEANINAKNRSSKTALELLRNAELKEFLREKHQQYRRLVLAVRQANHAAVTEALSAHARRESTFANLRSRCVGGDTLFHVAASTGNSDAIEVLIEQNVDCNVLNSQGATPLHVAKDAATIEILVRNQGNVNATDSNGNTALHIKCLGKAGQTTETDCIETLVAKGASLTLRNDRGLMPIHCCAERGRADAIRLLLERDSQGKMQRSLERESDTKPPSLLYLALSNDFYHCCDWLSQNGFIFKECESDRLMLNILKQETECSTPTETIQLLIQNGASLDTTYEGGNTPLHLAVEHCSSSDAVEVLIANGADINALNDDSQTALFLATSGSQPYTASLLLKAGIDFRRKDRQGLNAFEFISDHEEWIGSGYFDDHMMARLKAYSLKQSRDLVRAISKRVRRGHRQPTVGTAFPALGSTSPPLREQIRSFAAVTSSQSMATWAKRRASHPRRSLQFPALTASPVNTPGSMSILFPSGDNNRSIIQSVVFRNRTS